MNAHTTNYNALTQFIKYRVGHLGLVQSRFRKHWNMEFEKKNDQRIVRSRDPTFLHVFFFFLSLSFCTESLFCLLYSSRQQSHA